MQNRTASIQLTAAFTNSPDLFALQTLQDFYLEDILKFIGYKAPDNYSDDRAAAGSDGGSAEGALARLQRVATEQAIMDAFLKGDEGSWGRLLEVTGAQEGSANPACINAAHPATGCSPPLEPWHSLAEFVCLFTCASVLLAVCQSVLLWTSVPCPLTCPFSWPVCLPACQPACLPVCLSVCLSVCLPVCLYVSVCLLHVCHTSCACTYFSLPNTGWACFFSWSPISLSLSWVCGIQLFACPKFCTPLPVPLPTQT